MDFIIVSKDYTLIIEHTVIVRHTTVNRRFHMRLVIINMDSIIVAAIDISLGHSIINLIMLTMLTMLVGPRRINHQVIISHMDLDV